MALKPNVQKIIFRASTTQHVERLRCVSGILPADVRLAFEQKTATTVSCTELLKAPIDAESPFILPDRPNFWIPIIYVFSYVIPFFMLCVVSYIEYIPGFPELVHKAPFYGCGRIGIQYSIQNGCFFLSFLVVPMLAGGKWGSCLATKIRMNIKLKLLAWCVPTLAVCFIDIYIAAAFWTLY